MLNKIIYLILMAIFWVVEVLLQIIKLIDVNVEKMAIKKIVFLGIVIVNK